MKHILIIIQCFITIALFGQQTATLNVFFDIDQHDVRASDLQNIKTFLSSIPIHEITKIELLGHTDNRRDDAHNQVLSQRRVESVKAVLLEFGIEVSVFVVTALGETKPQENNDSELGRQQNRRTEIIVHYTIPPPPQEEPVPVVIETPYKEKKDYCRDKIVDMPSGIKVIMKNCDYDSLKHCFEFNEYVHPDSARAAGLNTMASTGQPMFSAGMFRISVCKPNVCMNVLMPIKGSVCYTNIPCDMKLYERTENGWELVNDKPLKIIEISGQKYYQMKVCKSGTFNVDCYPEHGEPVYTSTIKVKKGYKLLEANLSVSQPLVISTGKNTSKPNFLNVEVYSNNCPQCQEVKIYAKALAPNGDTLVRTYISAYSYHRKALAGICKQAETRPFWVLFRAKKRGIYKRYFLRPKDFDFCYKPQEENGLSAND